MDLEEVLEPGTPLPTESEESLVKVTIVTSTGRVLVADHFTEQ
jgi:hypothetical protein